MSDHIEHACPVCGSLLHFADKCPKREEHDAWCLAVAKAHRDNPAHPANCGCYACGVSRAIAALDAAVPE